MNHGPLIFLGIFLSLGISWYGIIVGSVLQLGKQQPVALDAGGRYPTARPGLAQWGRDVYRANGCQYCHTLQVGGRVEVKGTNFLGYVGSDLARGWGDRPSVAQDFIFDRPVMLGNQRIGQDLANIGARSTNDVWHLLHLFNPRAVSPGSVMPAYPYLFETKKIGHWPATNALILPDTYKVPAGYEVVPTREAIALVAYLSSLNASVPLFEVQLPLKKEEGTNAPTVAPATNTAARTIMPALDARAELAVVRP